MKVSLYKISLSSFGTLVFLKSIKHPSHCCSLIPVETFSNRGNLKNNLQVYLFCQPCNHVDGQTDQKSVASKRMLGHRRSKR